MESELLEVYDDIFRVVGESSLKEALRGVNTEAEFLSFSESKGVFLMNSLIIFAIFAMAAYVFQIFLGWQQLKDFNKTYTILREIRARSYWQEVRKIKFWYDCHVCS